MSSADCDCCGQPTTMPEPIEVETEECCCGCFDCTECEDCGYGDCFEVVTVLPLVLCDSCSPEDEPCGPNAWHCTCGRACDGSACPGEQYQAYADYVRGPRRDPRRVGIVAAMYDEYRNGSTCGPDCPSHGHLRGADHGGS